MFCGPTRPPAARRPPFVREQVPAHEHRLPRRWRRAGAALGARRDALSRPREHRATGRFVTACVSGTSSVASWLATVVGLLLVRESRRLTAGGPRQPVRRAVVALAGAVR
jgi:hypothetical protein